MKQPANGGARKDLAILIAVSIAVTSATTWLTMNAFHTKVDVWGYMVYLQSVVAPFLQNGSLPYIDYVWNYPPMMLVPTAIATGVMLITNEQAETFFWAYGILMFICNAVSICCVYFISRKIYNKRHTAFVAGFLAATAFSASYHTIICYDAFAVMLMMLGIAFTIYEYSSMKSYGTIILGYFTKLFPLVVLPFLFLYNAKKTNLKTEAVDLARISLWMILLLVIPFLVLAPSIINVYLNTTGMDNIMIGSSFAYMIYAIIHDVLKVSIGYETLSIFMYVILAFVLVVLMLGAYKDPVRNPANLIKYCLLALTALILFVPHHSPQYMIWIVPLLAILAAVDSWNVIWFYFLQMLLYIRFPLMFEWYWDNAGYNGWWGISLVFFLIQFGVLIYLVVSVTKPKSLLKVIL